MVRHTSNIQSEKVLFRQTFDSPVEIAKAGGVITGSPSFKSGIVLDGSTDYITYGIPSTIFDKSELTVVIEFIPDFEAEDGLNHWFCDATNGQRFYLAKPTNNRLVMYVGAVAAINASAAEFSPYWEKGKRNVLVIVITTGANFGYLNGTQIDTTSNSITPVVPTEFYIGSNYTGVNLFDGTIKSLSIHNRLFTDVEAQALYDNSLFSFQNKAEIWLDMKAQVGEQNTTELLLGDMDLGSYSAVNSAALSNPTSEILRVARNGSNNPGAQQTIIVSGSRYKVTGEARSDGSAAPRVRDNTTNVWVGAVSTDWQEIDFALTAASTQFILNASASGSEYVEFRNVSVQLIEQTTKDKSSNGNHFLLGDGTTTTKFPSFSAPGFDLDGSSDYLLNSSATGIFNNASQSIVLCLSPDFAANDGSYHYLIDTQATGRYLLAKLDSANSNRLSLTLGGTFIAQVELSGYGDLWRMDGTNVLVISAETGNTDLYLNGVKIVDANNTAWVANEVDTIYLGTLYALASYFDGTIFHFSTYPFKLSPIQAERITETLQSEYK